MVARLLLCRVKINANASASSARAGVGGGWVGAGRGVECIAPNAADNFAGHVKHTPCLPWLAAGLDDSMQGYQLPPLPVTSSDWLGV